MIENLELFFLPERHVAKRTTPQRDVRLEPMQQTGHFPGRSKEKDRMELNNRMHKTLWMDVSGLHPNIWTRNAMSSLRNSEWQPGDHQRNISNIPGGVWHQLRGTNVESSSLLIFTDSTANTKENTHMPEIKRRSDVESQMLPIKASSLQNPEPPRNSSEKAKLEQTIIVPQ